MMGTETTNNMYSGFNIAYFYGDGAYIEQDRDLTPMYNDITLPFLAANMTYPQMLNNTAWSVLPFWFQMFSVIGYEPARFMHRKLREKFVDPSDTTCTGPDSGKYDAVYELLCQYSALDLTKHFDTYGVPLSTAVRQRVAAKNYPQPSVDISKVVVKEGLRLTWKTNPSYALPAFKTVADAQF